MKKIKEKFEEVFSIDLRSLALFRVCFALLLIVDLVQRASDLNAAYTDWGILPRKAVYEFLLPNEEMWTSPFFFSGSFWWPAFLFVCDGFLCLLLMIGYRTGVVAAVCWLFLLALQDRNTLIIYGGDMLIRCILLWAIFLPMGAKFSVDRVLANPQPPLVKKVFSIASVGYILQVCLVYWSSVAFKWNFEWLDGMAVRYSLNIEQFTTPIGLWVLQHTDWLPILTRMVLFTELLGPILALSPFFTGPIRTFVIFSFALMHLCFGLCLKIDLFPFMSIVTWIPLLPPWFWEKLAPLSVYFNDLCRRIDEKTHFTALLKKNLSSRPLNIQNFWLEKLIAGFLLVYVILFNITVTNAKIKEEMPRDFFKLGVFLHFEQFWGMFATPLREDGWYVIPGKLLSGKEVDVFTGGKEISWEKPKPVSATFKNTRWIKYLQYIMQKDYVNFRQFYAQYLCRQWNSTHEGMQKLESFQIYFILNRTQDDFSKGPPKKFLLWTHNCLAPEPVDEPDPS